MHEPIRNNETKRGGRWKHYKFKICSYSFVDRAFRGGFVLVRAPPPPPLHLTSNPVPSFSDPSFGSDLKLRGCRDAEVPDVLGVWRRFVVGTGFPGARLGPE